MNKPFAQSCEENQWPILQVLSTVFTQPGTVLEIGSGTGQHAVYFAAQLPHLNWQPTDRISQLEGIELWRADAGLDNVQPARELDVDAGPWPQAPVEYVFSANTAHILAWASVQNMLAGIGRVLRPGGCFALYGPFNYAGRFTSDSNARFDDWLKQRDPDSGIRHFEDMVKVAAAHGLALEQDFTMPVNNRTLLWRKSAA